MAKMTGFVFQDEYLDRLEKLSDQELGRLVRALSGYHATGEVPELERLESVIFEFIRADIDRIDRQYREKSETNRAHRMASTDSVRKKQRTLANADEKQQALTNSDEMQRTPTNHDKTAQDKVKDIVKEKEKDKDKEKKTDNDEDTVRARGKEEKQTMVRTEAFKSRHRIFCDRRNESTDSRSPPARSDLYGRFRTKHGNASSIDPLWHC